MNKRKAPWTLKQVYRDYTKADSAQSLANSGSTTAVGEASLRRVLSHMALTEHSVLLDIGCGSGLPGLCAASVYGCKTVGFDIDPVLVSHACENAKRMDLSSLCTYVPMDATDLKQGFLAEHKVTHVYMFDAVFPVVAWKRALRVILSSDNITTIVSNFSAEFVDMFDQVAKTTASFSPAGSSKRVFYVHRRRRRAT